MNKQQTNQMASLRKKLMAAIAMLLVACIMTVSSTYAWFTLSTAPEVRGISTTIGANGNLEMALGTNETFYGDANPTSYVSSSYSKTGDYTASNITWGNLVDLSDSSYGLNAISLYPSRLNSTGTNINRTSPLLFPKYGSDGRVTELSDNSLVGKYYEASAGFVKKNDETSTGVSGIGATSSMSQRAFAVMNGKSDILSYKEGAKNAAKDAIRLYGGKLAAIALKYQNDNGTGVVAEKDINELKNLIAKLQLANNNISESMKSAVLVVLAASPDLNDDAWSAAVALASDKNISEFIAAVEGQVSVPTPVTNLVSQHTAIQDKLNTASAALPESGSCAWSVIKDSVSALLDASGIKIGGYTISDVKADYVANGSSGEIVKALFNKVSDGSLTYTFTEESGIFADIAKLTGKYTSSMAFPEGTMVETLDISMLGAKPVEVESGAIDPVNGELGVMYNGVKDKEAPAADATADKPLTDTFGYIIDLLFRTNATESNLLLQTEGVDRYSENGGESTDGNGSNITFTISGEYSAEKIKGLAAGIRVVFFDNAGKILGVATLDVDNGTVAGDAYKMNLYLHEYTIDSEGKITIGAKKTDAKLAALTANEKFAMSALVYLDGDDIDNSVAGVSDELKAMVNLQFSSSESLKPMENADLMAG